MANSKSDERQQVIGKIVGVRYGNRPAVLDPGSGIWYPAKDDPFTISAFIALIVGIVLIGFCAAAMAAFVIVCVVLWL